MKGLPRFPKKTSRKRQTIEFALFFISDSLPIPIYFELLKQQVSGFIQVYKMQAISETICQNLINDRVFFNIPLIHCFKVFSAPSIFKL